MEILARSVGRRKEAVAQVQIVKGTGQFLINNKLADEYLQNNSCSIISVKAPLEILKKLNHEVDSDETTNNVTNLAFDTFVKVKGGGIIGQAEAIKLGLARAICEINSVPLQSLLIVDPFVTPSSQIEGGPLLNGKAHKEEEKNTNEEKKTNSSILAEVRKQFKTKGYLTQDARVKERRKYGLKKARKATQYHKR
jgi:small subunit ribosomal protein S9|uniref:Small ribosomal subunit protein uS9c n=1 Tax=Chlamydomonas sp. ICE-L TaxID=309537 RepID=A0A345K510_9CHLO|nr:ribosomal protein S9 [Chlamydomonas sp. ICE-L]